MRLRDKCERDVAAAWYCTFCRHAAEDRLEEGRPFVREPIHCWRACRAVRNYRRRMAYAAARKGAPCDTSS